MSVSRKERALYLALTRLADPADRQVMLKARVVLERFR